MYLFRYFLKLALLALMMSSPKLSMASGSGPSLPPIYLEVGEQRSLHLGEIQRFSISSDCIRHWRDPQEDRILLKALCPGTATLFLKGAESGNTTRLIRIEQKRAGIHPPELLTALNLLHTTEVIDAGARFILRGTVHDPSEALGIAKLRDLFPNFILDETRVDASWATRSFQELSKLVARYPTLHLEDQEGEFRIHGSLPSEMSLESVRKQALAIQPLTRFEIQNVKGSDTTLYFKVFLLEVRKELMQKLGVQWPAIQPSALNFNPMRFGGPASIDLTIQALSEKGMARILSSPELVVKAPGQAELFAGGELPIRQRNRFNETINWKNFGLTLKIDVKEFSSDQVRLIIETEISHLDSTLMQNEIPGLKSNRIKTLVDGRIGKPLLLSGLLQEDQEETRKGLAGLSSIPILGRLFSSEDFQNKRSELMAILLPHRSPPEAPMQRISSDIPKGYLPLPRDWMSEEEREAAKNHPDYPWNVL